MTRREMERIRPRAEIQGLRAYRLRQDAPVKLNQNESPFDWPEAVKAEVLARVAARPWNRYPPVDGAALRSAYARETGVARGMIALTNGSNEAILAVIEAFATGRAAVLTAPGYSMSRTLAVIGGAQIRSVTLRPDFSLDVPAVLREMEASDAAVVCLASPNNPTGRAFAPEDIEAILKAEQGIVVVDEAYVQFVGASVVGAVARYPHLVVLRTFSKAFALAGARIGWVIAREDVIEVVGKTLPPYNVNVFAQEAALAALRHAGLVADRVRLIVQERERIFAALASVPGVTPYPSQTNFVLFRTALDAPILFERLLARGVLIRDVSDQPLLERCLRVTIGTPEDNDRFLAALRASLEHVG